MHVLYILDMSECYSNVRVIYSFDFGNDGGVDGRGSGIEGGGCDDDDDDDDDDGDW